MSFSAPILSRDQIEEVRNLVHGILEQNKRIIDDVLSQLVDVESTNILGLYNLVVEQWHKKQTTVDNLCHFALTMMATVQLLWDQKFHNDEILAQAKKSIEQLKTENEQLKAQNIKNKVEIGEIKQDNSPSEMPVEKIEALIKCQSCIHFRENSKEKQQQKGKCESVAGENASQSLNDKKSQQQQGSQVQSLREDKRRLEEELSQVKQQSQLAKMQLQLAELAIQDALVYKTSYLSLIQSSASRISQKSRSLDNPDYLNGEIQCQSHIEDSFTKEAKNFFIEYNHEQEKDKEDKHNKGKQKNVAVMKSTVNPFKKKSYKSVVDYQGEEHTKSMNFEDNDSNQDQFEAYRPESHMLEEKRVTEMIQRFKLKKSKISDRQQTAEESLQSENSLFRPKPTSASVQFPKKQSESNFGESSVSKFYDFLTKKVVRNRIKKR